MKRILVMMLLIALAIPGMAFAQEIPDGLVWETTGISVRDSWNGYSTDTKKYIILEGTLTNWALETMTVSDNLSANLSFMGKYQFEADLLFDEDQIEPLIELNGAMAFWVPNMVAEAADDKIAITITVSGEEQVFEGSISEAAAESAAKAEAIKRDFAVGNAITMGNYGGEAIEWQVLDVQENRALLLSKYGLDAKPYNTEYADITWERCSMRKWLNEEFLNAAFSAEERSKIIRVKISNPDNTTRKTEGGNDTDDQVFLLSIDEAEKYFATGDARKTEPTAHAKSSGVWTNDSGYCWWWLRSPGLYQNSAASVRSGGDVDGNGYVDSDDRAVRPAFWLNLES